MGDSGQKGDYVDVLVMVYPGAVCLRLDGLIRHKWNTQLIDVQLGGYVLRFRTQDLRDGVEHPWRPNVLRPEVVGGTQVVAVPVERYNDMESRGDL